VPVLGGNDVVVVGGVLVGVVADRRGNRCTALDGKRSALAEVVLHVDDDERSGHGRFSSYSVG
jgi:hypothetical protein